MVVKKQIAALLAQEMDRKDFLNHLVIGAVALVGPGWLVRVAPTRTDSTGDNGYDRTSYGGRSGGKS